MGTRAQFFIGNPLDIASRVWLGAVAWDGYPDGDIGDAFEGIRDEASFRAAVADISTARSDFCDPDKMSFPFPWADDLFLTDCTYALFDGAVQFTWFHAGFVPLDDYRAYTPDEEEAYSERKEKLPGNVPAPITSGPPGPDSIIVVSAA